AHGRAAQAVLFCRDMVRTGVFFIVVGLGLAIGCTNDFDALFANGKTDKPPPADPAEADEPAGNGGPIACKPISSCNAKTCDNSCNGPDCTCPTFDCDGANDLPCSTTCAAGTICSVSCGKIGSCSMKCDGDSCEMDCSLSGDCSATCGAKSS